MNLRTLVTGLTIGLAAGGVTSANASPITLDFNTDALNNAIQTGQVIDDEFAGYGITITGDSSNWRRPDKVIAFDSANPTGGDPDLATPGYGPNNHAALGMLLILAEDDRDQNNDGFIDDPDDDAGGGYIQFAFDTMQQASGSIGLVDIEESGGKVELMLAGDVVHTIAVPGFGDNNFQSVGFGLTQFDTMRVTLKGSGAIGAVAFDSPTAVPEPASIALFGLGAALIAYRRRTGPVDVD